MKQLKEDEERRRAALESSMQELARSKDLSLEEQQTALSSLRDQYQNQVNYVIEIEY